jgi:hypothetical protein
MRSSRLMVRASVIALAFGLLQGCAAHREQTAEASMTDKVMDHLYTKRMRITGSRIARRVDLRRPIEVQGSQAMKVVKVE